MCKHEAVAVLFKEKDCVDTQRAQYPHMDHVFCYYFYFLLWRLLVWRKSLFLDKGLDELVQARWVEKGYRWERKRRLNPVASLGICVI